MNDWTKYSDYGLYLVTDEALCLGRPILEVVKEAVKGGVKAVQIREKNNNTRDFLELAKLLVKEVQSQGIPIIINDRVDIALASNAAGIHVGQSDMPVLEARKLLGDKKIIGLTVPNMDILKLSYDLPVEYLAVSPVFLTNTKKDTAPAWGVEGMKKAREFLNTVNYKKPLMTIGGINKENAKAILEAGIDSLAIVSAICSANDPRLASEEILAQFQ